MRSAVDIPLLSTRPVRSWVNSLYSCLISASGKRRIAADFEWFLTAGPFQEASAAAIKRRGGSAMAASVALRCTMAGPSRQRAHPRPLPVAHMRFAVQGIRQQRLAAHKPLEKKSKTDYRRSLALRAIASATSRMECSRREGHRHDHDRDIFLLHRADEPAAADHDAA
jgi:hypothetical protein